MSRTVRVNELVKRELSHIMHTYYRDQTVAITITEVDVSPDLRVAHVYYSVLGDTAAARAADKFFSARGKDLRAKVAKVIVLKYLPHFKFFRDNSIARGNQIVDLLNEIEVEDREQFGAPKAESDKKEQD